MLILLVNYLFMCVFSSISTHPFPRSSTLLESTKLFMSIVSHNETPYLCFNLISIALLVLVFLLDENVHKDDIYNFFNTIFWWKFNWKLSLFYSLSLDVFTQLFSSVDVKSHAKLKFLFTNKLLFIKSFSNVSNTYSFHLILILSIYTLHNC